MRKLFLSLALATVCVAPAFATTQPSNAKPTEPKKEAATEEKSATSKPSLMLVSGCCEQPGKGATAADKASPEKTPTKTPAPKLAFA
jgi:hypothetical protein